MKYNALFTLVFSLAITCAHAQDGPPDGQPPIFPVIAALDTNHDGIIDSNEMANASSALLKLDKNGDGKLSTDELMPRFPGGQKFSFPDGGKLPPFAFMTALDKNGDGELDAHEIANAAVALKTLDKNGDGKLTMEELLGPPPAGFGGPPDGNK